MDFMTDVRDWLGGYPYEHAKIEEILNFAREELRFELIKNRNRRSGHRISIP